MSDDYSIRQSRHDRSYQEAFDSPEVKAWIESLTPEERKRAEAEGLIAPLIFGRASGHSEKDLADSPLASETPDLIGVIEPDMHAHAPHAATETADALASFCARVRSASNPLLVFDAVCFATGVLAIEGQSATDLAAQYGVSKQAFSKIAVRWCETFGLRPSRSMKSMLARKSYQKRAKAFHEKRRLTRKKKA